jgi:hypothetical protein
VILYILAAAFGLFAFSILCTMIYIVSHDIWHAFRKKFPLSHEE